MYDAAEALAVRHRGIVVSARIRNRVIDLINQSALSHRAFAQSIGLSDDKLSKSLTGKRLFTSLDLARIADEYGVTVDWLVTGDHTVLESIVLQDEARTLREASRIVRARGPKGRMGLVIASLEHVASQLEAEANGK